MELRDNLYQRLTKLSPDSPDCELVKYNLKIYNRYLNQCIRNAMKDYYAREFTKYKGDIRKTWDTLKDILNKKKANLHFPRIFWAKMNMCLELKTSPTNLTNILLTLDHIWHAQSIPQIKLPSIRISIHPAPIHFCSNTPTLLILLK